MWKKYRSIVEEELKSICNEILSLLNDHLCKSTEGDGDENEVFYLKMRVDYQRFLCDWITEPEDKVQEFRSKTEEYYKKAIAVSDANLGASHSTSLELALNFSVFYYEVLRKPGKACALAQKALDVACGDESNDKYSQLYTQLLRDSLTLWTSGD